MNEERLKQSKAQIEDLVADFLKHVDNRVLVSVGKIKQDGVEILGSYCNGCSSGPERKVCRDLADAKAWLAEVMAPMAERARQNQEKHGCAKEPKKKPPKPPKFPTD